MKISKNQLKKIIAEEIQNMLQEGGIVVNLRLQLAQFEKYLKHTNYGANEKAAKANWVNIQKTMFWLNNQLGPRGDIYKASMAAHKCIMKSGKLTKKVQKQCDSGFYNWVWDAAVLPRIYKFVNKHLQALTVSGKQRTDMSTGKEAGSSGMGKYTTELWKNLKELSILVDRAFPRDARPTRGEPYPKKRHAEMDPEEYHMDDL